MAIVAEIKADGISVSEDSATVSYWVTGTDDYDEAVAAVLDVAPASLGGYPLQSPTADLEESMGDDVWTVGIVYREASVQKEEREKEKAEDEPTPELQFEIAGENVHITRSLLSNIYPRTGSPAPPGSMFRNLIGISRGSVEGVDIAVGTCTFSVVCYPLTSALTITYLSTLQSLFGAVNDATFGPFDAGELQYLGSSTDPIRSTNAPLRTKISHRFKASPNVTDLAVPGFVEVPKKGHEYVWQYYKDEPETTAKAVLPRPEYVVVEKVYPDADFSLLGIPESYLTPGP